MLVFGKMKDLSQVVEGPWGDYIFKIAGPSEYPEVSAFLWDNYYKDEPITLLLGFSEKKARDMDNVVKQFLEDSLSLMAVHQETGKVAAVRIAYDSRRKLNLTETFSSKENLKVQVAKDQLVEMAEKRLKECYFEEVYAMGFLSSVAPEHRGKGLASEIYARSLRQFVERGFQLTRNFFSSKV